MADNKLNLKPLPVKDAFEKWLDTASKIFQSHQVQATFLTSFSALQIDITDSAQNLNQRKEVVNLRQILSGRAINIECDRFTINQSGQRFSITYWIHPDKITASIQVDGIDDIDTALRVIGTLTEIYTIVPMAELITGHLPIVQQQMAKSHSAVLGQLQVETAKIAQFNLDQIEAHSQFLRNEKVLLTERQRQFEDELGQKRKQDEEKLAAEKKVSEEQIKAERAELEKREGELKRKREEIDIRDNMSARRQLQTDITNFILDQKEFKLSASVDEKRKSVQRTCIWFISASAFYLLLVILFWWHTLSKGGELKWYQYALFWVGLITLLSSAIYLLKWSDQWAREHAQAELRSNKLNADILRASWLAEMFFEGKDKDRLLPEMLLSRFSEGLFSDSMLSAAEHPSDQMVDLLKKLSSVKVSKEGVELTKSAAAEEKK